MEYSSGTVVGFCGLISEHGVGFWGNGDRVCYAHFMQESVRKQLDVPPAGWVDQTMYLGNGMGITAGFAVFDVQHVVIYFGNF